jgi:psp operon transcriptional activator
MADVALVPLDQHRALGESEAFLDVQERISRAARTDRPVILLGERGTGKELAAARLHLLSQRWNQPYLTMNCASLTESLIESELFGHEVGAFTGAVRLRKGRFEAANGGTMFLDEIATLPATVQENLLRVVEYGQMERVGSSRTIRVDVRLVAATNVNLREVARQGRFRQDLLDRLSFEVIVLPPLRERGEDILLMANHFARQMAHEMKLEQVPEFSRDSREQLMSHGWPGNIRELKNVVERMVYRSGGARIDAIEFDPFKFGDECEPEQPKPPPVAFPGDDDRFPAEELRALPLTDAVRTLELWRLRCALEQARFNQRKAAKLLGLTYDQLRNCLRKYRGELSAN